MREFVVFWVRLAWTIAGIYVGILGCWASLRLAPSKWEDWLWEHGIASERGLVPFLSFAWIPFAGLGAFLFRQIWARVFKTGTRPGGEGEGRRVALSRPCDQPLDLHRQISSVVGRARAPWPPSARGVGTCLAFRGEAISSFWQSFWLSPRQK
jgi:hypothetical protein